ncbi:MAG TPA: ferritin [Balneolaceae bacterium]|nr:ferritin [Balneolaceae bacterium]|tara:strand:- start:13280 stop:13915 length:636 start_codon:yes stop_codon:yes gene_type:complete
MKTTVLTTIIISALLTATSCEDVSEINSAPQNEITMCCIETASIENVTTEELESLTFMVEEEKMARDVYITLYSKWGQRAFNNISSSEQKHMDAVKNLLEVYEMTVPSTLETVGEFENELLQDLYDDLIAQGSESLVEALKVGALIEEVDIIDLDDLRATVVAEEAINYVYEQLRKGSENHLRAFVKNLTKQGVTYEPQLMSEEDYTAIVN